MRLIMPFVAILVAGSAFAAPQGTTFVNIDGGTLSLDDWAGQPVLVVNTASLCAFTPQYEDLQALYEMYRDQGLVVLAVPSDDFNQELADGAEVKDFCEITFGLDMPMTDITHVRGAQAHPFYQWVADDAGFAPGWNFNKILLDGQGDVVATWGSNVRPMSNTMISKIENLLN